MESDSCVPRTVSSDAGRVLSVAGRALAALPSGRSSKPWKSGSPRGHLSVRSDTADRLMLDAGNDGAFTMNDWSFGQLCRLAGVTKETVNRLSPDTAARVFGETLPQGQKPLQLFTHGGQLRSIHAASYTRLFNADLLAVIQEFAVGFEPPPKGFNGATGLYGGEQDMFCFLIDPAGWTEIGGEAFAPGIFVWNSEVGSRSVGIETFWFQAVCANHIVWDATEVDRVLAEAHRERPRRPQRDPRGNRIAWSRSETNAATASSRPSSGRWRRRSAATPRRSRRP